MTSLRKIRLLDLQHHNSLLRHTQPIQPDVHRYLRRQHSRPTMAVVPLQRAILLLAGVRSLPPSKPIPNPTITTYCLCAICLTHHEQKQRCPLPRPQSSLPLRQRRVLDPPMRTVLSHGKRVHLPQREGPHSRRRERLDEGVGSNRHDQAHLDEWVSLVHHPGLNHSIPANDIPDEMTD